MLFRLHVDQNSQENSILERGTYFSLQSASELDHAIKAFQAKYHVKVLNKCPSDLDLRRGLPVKASGGILGRLKAALVRVSHAVEAWFNKLLSRDVTLSLVIKHTDTGAMGKRGRSLSDPSVPVHERKPLIIRSRSLSDLSVWAENPVYERTTHSISSRSSSDPSVWAEKPVYERTTHSIRSRSLSDLSPVREANPLDGRKPLSISSRSLSDLSPVREANPQNGPSTRSISISDLTSEKDFDERSAGGTPHTIGRGILREDEQQDFLWDNYDPSAKAERGLEDFEATPGQRSASELIGRVLPLVQMKSSELFSHVLTDLEAVASKLAELAAKPETQGGDWVEELAQAIQAEDKENALERPGKTPR